jgi:hypothetical protein
MRSSLFSKLVAVCFSLSLPACAAIQAQHEAEQQKQQEFVQRVDIARIFVTPDDAPAGKPYKVLGDLDYTEHIDPDSIAEPIDAQKMNEQLRRMANEKYPDSVDAVIQGAQRRVE